MAIEFLNFNPNEIDPALDGQMITYEAECHSCDGYREEDGNPTTPPRRLVGFEKHLKIAEVLRICRAHDNECGWYDFQQCIEPNTHDIRVFSMNVPAIRHNLYGSTN